MQSVPFQTILPQQIVWCYLSYQIILKAGSQETATWTEAASKIVGLSFPIKEPTLFHGQRSQEVGRWSPQFIPTLILV